MSSALPRQHPEMFSTGRSGTAGLDNSFRARCARPAAGVRVQEAFGVALVVFAGTAVVRCPLTLDYGFFRMMLDDVSTRSVARGGTMIGDALRKTLEEVFDDQTKEKYEQLLMEAEEKLGIRPDQVAKK